MNSYFSIPRTFRSCFKLRPPAGGMVSPLSLLPPRKSGTHFSHEANVIGSRYFFLREEQGEGRSYSLCEEVAQPPLPTRLKHEQSIHDVKKHDINIIMKIFRLSCFF